jgi:threonine dehydrogenase-like Zn-dependent dehydrogenase
MGARFCVYEAAGKSMRGVKMSFAAAPESSYEPNLIEGDTVAIFGQGSMGTECLQIARNSGAGLLIMVDVREEACRMSRELGADVALNATQCDPVSAIRDLTGGNGADIVFECSGGSPKQGLAGGQTLLKAIDAVRSGGKIIGVSWFGQPLEVDIDTLRERSLRYLFPDISTLEHLEFTVRLVSSGRVRLKPAITQVLNGIESVRQALRSRLTRGNFKPSIQPR